jgi:DNA polymerase III subunit beta
MRVELSQTDFLVMLQTVIDAVPVKPTLPVLSTILMVAEGGTCSLSATDLELSVTTSIPMEALEAGRMTFPARKMHDIVRELPTGPLTVAETDGRVTLTSATGEYSLLSMPDAEFPSMPEGLEGASLAVEGDLLRRMISKVAFANHPDETRPTLHGICWRVGPANMMMVATDGHRLAKVTESVEVGTEQTMQVIVPPRVLQQAVKLMREDNLLERITVGERQIHFSYTNAELFARLIEGAYVDVDAVIPKDNSIDMVVSDEALVPAVRRMLILSSQQNHQIRLSIGANSLELSTLNRETGAEARESIEVQYDAEPMEIGYNANYLLEVLGKIDTADVRFRFREPVSAAIVEPADQQDGEEHFCLLMPLRPVDV